MTAALVSSGEAAVARGDLDAAVTAFRAAEACLGGWLVRELAGVLRAKLDQPATGRREP